MYHNANPLFLLCETQLHAGSGDDLGIVDLPIQRERHTSFPKIEASSLKGAIREAFEECQKEISLQENDKKSTLTSQSNLWHEYVHKIFGYDDKSKRKPESITETEFAGCIGLTDARLLLFPVKSMKGIFAWITCPRVLRQFEKDMKLTEQNSNFLITAIPDVNDGEVYLVHEASTTPIDSKVKTNVVLEEYAFEIKGAGDVKIGDKSLGDWLAEKLFVGQTLKYWEEKIKKDILILSDNDFRDFVNLSTEVITRIKINNETGTVQDGALFTEEFLPTESLLYTLVLTSSEFANTETPKNGKRLTEPEVKRFFQSVIEAQSVIQIGGNATLGKGLVRTRFITQKGDIA